MSIKKSLLKSWVKPNALTAVLKPLSSVYKGAFAARKQAFKRGLFSRYRSPVPVIVVGNLTVGGTGKTPLVIYLVEQLKELGFSPGVISRGYSGKADSYPLEVCQETAVAECGDEPALIVKRTGAPMAVGPNRQESIELLLSRYSIDIIVSDDGLQHLALERDIEVCLVDDTVTHQNDELLPAGPYREPLSRLLTVDFIVRHGGHVGNAENQFTMALSPSEPKPLLAENKASFPFGERIEAIAGIGQPQRFFDTCRALGLQINEHRFADHHHFIASDLDFDGAPVLMTEKDAVKCTAFAANHHWYLPVDAELSDGLTESIIKKIGEQNSGHIIHGNIHEN